MTYDSTSLLQPVLCGASQIYQLSLQCIIHPSTLFTVLHLAVSSNIWKDVLLLLQLNQTLSHFFFTSGDLMHIVHDKRQNMTEMVSSNLLNWCYTTSMQQNISCKLEQAFSEMTILDSFSWSSFQFLVLGSNLILEVLGNAEFSFNPDET